MIMNESRSFLPCRQLIYISEKKVFDFFRSFLVFFEKLVCALNMLIDIDAWL